MMAAVTMVGPTSDIEVRADRLAPEVVRRVARPVHAPIVAVAIAARDDVVFLDPYTGTQRGRVQVGEGPHEIVASADSSRFFVAVTGRLGIAEVDPVAERLVRWISTAPDSPHDLVLGDATGELWAASGMPGAILGIDLARGAQSRRVIAGEGSWMIERAGRHVVTADLEGGGLTILDTATGRVTRVATEPGEIGLAPLGEEAVIAANAASGRVRRIDLRRGEVVATAARPLSSPIRVRWIPASDLLLVTHAGLPSLSLLHGPTLEVVEEIPLPAPVKNVAFVPGGRYAVLTSPDADAVFGLDLLTRELVWSAPIGGDPDGVAVGLAP